MPHAISTVLCFFMTAGVYIPRRLVLADLVMEECKNNGARNADIITTNPTPRLTCTGLDNCTRVVWKIKSSTLMNQFVLLANGSCLCPPTPPGGSCLGGSCSWSPDSFITNLTRSRDGRESTMYIRPAKWADFTNVSCKQGNGSEASCKVTFIQAYRISECKNGTVNIHENGNFSMNCTGSNSQQKLYWTLTFRNTTTKTSTCYSDGSCAGSDLLASRQPNWSTLTVQDRSRDLEGAIVKCSKFDNATHDQCTLTVLAADVSNGQPAAMSTTTMAGIAGAAGAVFLVIVIVIAVVVIARKRGSKKLFKSQERLGPTTSVGSAVEFTNEGYYSCDLLDKNKVGHQASPLSSAATVTVNGDASTPPGQRHPAKPAATAAAPTTTSTASSSSAAADETASRSLAAVCRTESGSERYYCRINSERLSPEGDDQYSYALAADYEEKLKSVDGKQADQFSKTPEQARNRGDKTVPAAKQKDEKDASNYYNVSNIAAQGYSSGEVYANIGDEKLPPILSTSLASTDLKSSEYDKLQFNSLDRRDSNYSHLQSF